ncbi:MAG: hypothetical protein QNJ55_04380 [Xenococcus sp. MO_188.B8]|nr:hypothetical protein [Xenococcus sp. MO_188.B8]
MSNINNQMLEIAFNNQDLFMELDEKDGEKVSGGYEVFTINNETQYDINYFVDGKLTKPKFAKPGSSSVWTAYDGGIIEFDTDGRNDYKQWKKYDLSDGGVYAFRDNKSTPGNPYDIELYKIS